MREKSERARREISSKRFFGRRLVLKRSTDTRRSPAEVKANLQKHYGGMAERTPNRKAKEEFKRPVYQVARLIRKQGECLHETPEE